MSTSRRPPQGDVRAAASWVVERTLGSRTSVDAFLPGALARFDARDQGLLTELVLGTLRWLRRLDHVLARASSRRLADIDPVLLAPLRVGAYQLLFLDRVPAHAVVDEAVEQARQLTHRGGASFTNAVLRRIARTPALSSFPVEEGDPVRRMAIELSHPDLLAERWVSRFGAATARALMEANNRPKPLHLLAFRDRGGRELLAEMLIDEGVDVAPSRLSPLGLICTAGNALATRAFHRGEFYIQDEASQVAAWLPPPRPGERVLDAAAAPGGKTFALLALEPSLKVVAADVAVSRLGTLAANCTRLRRRIPLLGADAGEAPLAGRFDRVLLDLPCTGTGTLRKHPELKWRISEDEIGRLASQGARLLRGVAPLVAPGGLLVAISCSLEEEENEGAITQFLASARDFEPLALEDHLTRPLDHHIRGPGLWRILTADDHDGFSVQVLRRR